MTGWRFSDPAYWFIYKDRESGYLGQIVTPFSPHEQSTNAIMLFTSKFITTLLAATTAILAHRPENGNRPWHHNGGDHKPCLNETGINTLVDGYTYLLQFPGGPDFNSTASAILADDFVVWSDSILTLSGRAVCLNTLLT